MSIETLSSSAITARLRALLAQGRQVDVEVLVHLAEFDRRRAWAELGYGSLWEYCKRELKLLECATFHRTTAARILQRIPEAADYLRDGRLGMSTLVVLKDVLDESNARALLDRASGKSRDDVKEIVASLREPAPVPAASIRRVPVAAANCAIETKPVVGLSFDAARGAGNPQVRGPEADGVEEASPSPGASLPAAMRAPARRPEIEPVARDQYNVRFVADREFVEMLKKVRALESHAVPDGDLVTLLRRGLEALVRKHEAKKGPKRAKRPAPASPVAAVADAPGVRDSSQTETDGSPRGIEEAAIDAKRRKAVPAEVRRAVWERDEGRCVWETASGPCGSTWKVEGDHIIPEALGGEATVENMRLLCRDHNEQHARDVFGDAWIERCKEEGRARSREGRRRANARGRPRTGPLQ
ncbi:MAG TPA: HNH endonuclease signature motif containing protein [bacterium]|nr:HNH endonuclease signature motif containing protein [bacterium]